MLSLPQTLPARMYVPYLAGEAHVAAISPSCLTSAKLCLDAICAPMLVLQPFLSPTASEQHVLLFHCLLLSPVHHTVHFGNKAWPHSE